MLVKIGSYEICNGTLAGGFAVGSLRLRGDRGFDIAIPIGETVPVLFDRLTTQSDITFQVYRTHADLQASEDFILNLHNEGQNEQFVMIRIPEIKSDGHTPGVDPRFIADIFLNEPLRGGSFCFVRWPEKLAKENFCPVNSQ